MCLWLLKEHMPTYLLLLVRICAWILCPFSLSTAALEDARCPLREALKLPCLQRQLIGRHIILHLIILYVASVPVQNCCHGLQNFYFFLAVSYFVSPTSFMKTLHKSITRISLRNSLKCSLAPKVFLNIPLTALQHPKIREFNLQTDLRCSSLLTENTQTLVWTPESFLKYAPLALSLLLTSGPPQQSIFLRLVVLGLVGPHFSCTWLHQK